MVSSELTDLPYPFRDKATNRYYQPKAVSQRELTINDNHQLAAGENE